VEAIKGMFVEEEERGRREGGEREGRRA